MPHAVSDGDSLVPGSISCRETICDELGEHMHRKMLESNLQVHEPNARSVRHEEGIEMVDSHRDDC